MDFNNDYGRGIIDLAKRKADSIDYTLIKEKTKISRENQENYLWGTYPPLIGMDAFDGDRLLEGNIHKEFDVYVHIPFCKNDCSYCHFYHISQAQFDDNLVDSYIEALRQEIEIVKKSIGGVLRAKSIYIGGGTPSALSLNQIRKLLKIVRDCLGVGKESKPDMFSFDIHPNILDESEKLELIRQMGVDRISIGVVDLDDNVLAAQRRHYSEKNVIELIKKARRIFPNIVTDLVMGLPHQTYESWLNTIKTIADNMVDCITAFPLMIKASSEISCKTYEYADNIPESKEVLTMQILSKMSLEEYGYRQEPLYYFNRTEKRSTQQMRKFSEIGQGALLGIGTSSFGFINNHQYFNTPCITDYISEVNNGKMPTWRGIELSRRMLFERALIFGLRFGFISEKKMKDRFGFSVLKEYAGMLKGLEGAGLLFAEPEGIRLTETGQLFTEEIASRFAGSGVIKRAERMAERIPPDNPRQVLSFAPVGHRSKTGIKQKRKCRMPCNTCK